MDWLLHNPIADMPGPYFLMLQFAVIVVLVSEAYWTKFRSDPTREVEPPPVPNKPDPYAIAYLRGGTEELARMVVFSLIQRGALRLQPPKKRPISISLSQKIEQAPDAAFRLSKNPIERTAFDFFRIPRAVGELFNPGGLVARIKPECAGIAEALRDEELLSASEQVAAAWRVGLAGALVIVALSGYKLFVAVQKGRSNFAFLIMLTVLGLVALVAACHVPRLTQRGKRYLEQLQEAFAGLKFRTAEEDERAAMTGADPMFLLVPAVFGIVALRGTEYGYMADLFKKSTSGGGGGGCGTCGGGSGGGCGGGGCGGGGCGGGGCGGCGS